MIKFIGFKKDKIVVDMMRIISIEEVDTREVEIQLEGLSEPVLITKYTIEEVIKHINDNLGYEKWQATHFIYKVLMVTKTIL